MSRLPRVLLADDYPAMVKAVSRLLALDCEVVGSVDDGRALLEAAQRLQPDVIVLDIELPDMSGYEICRALKNNPETAHIPVVMLTMRDTHHDALDGMINGAVDYIAKDAFAAANLIVSLRSLGVLSRAV